MEAASLVTARASAAFGPAGGVLGLRSARGAARVGPGGDRCGLSPTRRDGRDVGACARRRDSCAGRAPRSPTGLAHSSHAGVSMTIRRRGATLRRHEVTLKLLCVLANMFCSSDAAAIWEDHWGG